MGLFLADASEQSPRAIRQHDAMDFGMVMYHVEKLIERFLRGTLRQGGEGLLRAVHIPLPHGLAQLLTARRVRRNGCRRDGMQNFIFAPALFLNAIGVP